MQKVIHAGRQGEGVRRGDLYLIRRGFSQGEFDRAVVTSHCTRQPAKLYQEVFGWTRHALGKPGDAPPELTAEEYQALGKPIARVQESLLMANLLYGGLPAK